MAAKARIHLSDRCKVKENLDSGLRRNDGKKCRLFSGNNLELLGSQPRNVSSLRMGGFDEFSFCRGDG